MKALNLGEMIQCVNGNKKRIKDGDLQPSSMEAVLDKGHAALGSSSPSFQCLP